MNGSSLGAVYLGGLAFVTLWVFNARFVRRHSPFPIPFFMVSLINNPIRRLVQPLHKAPQRLGLHPGMRVLEIGPGKGSYTVAAAKAVGPSGQVVAVDIDDRILQRLKKRLQWEGVTNLVLRQGDAQALDLAESSFDVVFAITVFGEKPNRRRALAEFHRVLKPGGTLALSEFLPDPDYRPAHQVRKQYEAAGFQFREKTGNLLHYTMLFEGSRNNHHDQHQVDLDHPERIHPDLA